MLKLYDLFIKKDIVLLEINPLTEGADGKVYCKYISLISQKKRIYLMNRYGLQNKCR